VIVAQRRRFSNDPYSWGNTKGSCDVTSRAFAGTQQFNYSLFWRAFNESFADNPLIVDSTNAALIVSPRR
jgi:hypothetical protein